MLKIELCLKLGNDVVPSLSQSITLSKEAKFPNKPVAIQFLMRNHKLKRRNREFLSQDYCKM